MKKGILYAILASVLWAIVNPFIKQGLSYDFTPMNFAGLRFTVVGIILFAYTWHGGMWREIVRHKRLFGNLILVNMFLGYTAFYFGVDFVSGAISSIVMGLTPLINVLLAHLLASDDRLNRYKVVSLLVSLAGLLLIVGTGSDGSPLDWRGIGGIVLLLASIVFQGYSAISVSEDKGKVDPIFLNAVQMFFGGLLIYGVGIATEGFAPFWAKPGGLLRKPRGAGLHLGLCVQLLVYGPAHRGYEGQRHQHVPSDKSRAGGCPELDHAARRISPFQHRGRYGGYRQFAGHLLQRRNPRRTVAAAAPARIEFDGPFFLISEASDVSAAVRLKRK